MTSWRPCRPASRIRRPRAVGPDQPRTPLKATGFNEIGALTKYTDRKTREAITERIALLTTQGQPLGYTVRSYVQEPTKTPSQSGTCSPAGSAYESRSNHT
jgi:hypothetical protein